MAMVILKVGDTRIPLTAVSEWVLERTQARGERHKQVSLRVRTATSPQGVELASSPPLHVESPAYGAALTSADNAIVQITQRAANDNPGAAGVLAVIKVTFADGGFVPVLARQEAAPSRRYGA